MQNKDTLSLKPTNKRLSIPKKSLLSWIWYTYQVGNRGLRIKSYKTRNLQMTKITFIYGRLKILEK